MALSEKSAKNRVAIPARPFEGRRGKGETERLESAVAGVRKRLVMGAIAAVVIGVAAYVFSQPGEGTVEWHKAKYLQATGVDGGGRAIFGRVQRWYDRMRYGSLARCGGVLTGADRAEFESKTQAVQAEATKHYSALLKLGYLSERTVTITGAHTRSVEVALNSWREPFVKAQVKEVGTNLVIIVTAPASALGKHEAFIRKADAPVYEDTVAAAAVDER